MNKKRQNQAKKLLEDINKYKPEVEKILFDGEKESSLEIPIYWYCCLLLVMKRMRPNLDEETFCECNFIFSVFHYAHLLKHCNRY